ncbi:MAG: lipid II flippase MurJ [Patescibacteria group bacterium]
MIKKVFNFVNKDISGLHKAAYILAFSSLLSQILALLRDRVLAHSFGAGEILDIYYASFRIPDFIFISVASLVSVSVLVPYLSKEREEGISKKFMDEIFSLFFVLILIVCLGSFFLMPTLIFYIFRGFSVDMVEQTIVLSRILLLSPILLGFSNFFTSIIQIKKKFFVYALSPLLYNIGIIIGIILFYPVWGMKGLAMGVILGALFHLIIQLPSIYRLGFIPKATLVTNFGKIKKIMFLSLPRTLALSAGNLAVLFLLAVASNMAKGSIAVFNFAFALQSVPLSIIGVSYSVAAFPVLSKLTHEKKDEFLRQVGITTRYIIFWTLMATVLFVVLRAQVVRVVLGSGKFSWVDTRLTAACLALFAISITAQSLILFFVKGYYAAGITKRPVLINIFSSILIVIFAFMFKWIFVSFPVLLDFLGSILKISDIVNIDVIVLPLSYSLANIINMLLLFFFIKKDFKYLTADLNRSFYQVCFASLVLGGVAYFSLELWNNFFNINTLFGIFCQGFLSGLSGILVAIITLKVLKNQEIEEIFASIKQRIR